LHILFSSIKIKKRKKLTMESIKHKMDVLLSTKAEAEVREVYLRQEKEKFDAESSRVN
jgi:hypothetical protein